MGHLEESSRKRARKANIRRAVLEAVGVAGVLSVALLAPNALRIIKNLGWWPGKRQGEGVTRSRKNLVEHGLLKYQDGKLELTPKGEAKLRQLELHDFKLKRPKRWDGKWRMLIFDISEKRRKTRDQIRQTLQAIGFYKLQRSVWVYPYDCEDLTVLLKADLRVGKQLLYLIVDSVENDRDLRLHFGLED